ncbi:hypothetical protein FB45DRAFT_1056022, partial [Roridomyces roridus]
MSSQFPPTSSHPPFSQTLTHAQSRPSHHAQNRQTTRPSLSASVVVNATRCSQRSPTPPKTSHNPPSSGSVADVTLIPKHPFLSTSFANTRTGACHSRCPASARSPTTNDSPFLSSPPRPAARGPPWISAPCSPPLLGRNLGSYLPSRQPRFSCLHQWQTSPDSARTSNAGSSLPPAAQSSSLSSAFRRNPVPSPSRQVASGSAGFTFRSTPLCVCSSWFWLRFGGALGIVHPCGSEILSVDVDSDGQGSLSFQSPLVSSHNLRPPTVLCIHTKRLFTNPYGLDCNSICFW